MMGIVFKLDSLLDDIGVSKNALAREAKVRPNLIYELCDNKTKRIEIETFNKLLAALAQLAGRNVLLSEIIEYIPNENEETANH